MKAAKTPTVKLFGFIFLVKSAYSRDPGRDEVGADIVLPAPLPGRKGKQFPFTSNLLSIVVQFKRQFSSLFFRCACRISITSPCH